jgi:hypothetical protein
LTKNLMQKDYKIDKLCNSVIFMIKSIRDDYRIYGLIIVKTAKKNVNVKLWTFKRHF